MVTEHGAARQIKTVLYELCPVDDLPCVDLSQSLKGAIVPCACLPAVNRLLRTSSISSIAYGMAVPIGVCVPFIPVRIAQPLTWVMLVLQVPLSLIGLLSLRLQLLLLLVRTYEFWFFTVVSTATCFVFAFHLGDDRATLTPIIWLGLQLNICIDANLREVHKVAGASVAGIIGHAVILVALIFSTLPDVHSFELFKYHKRALLSQDFLINGFVTMTVLMIRTVYRKREALRNHEHAQSVICCVSYRCTVKLREYSAQNKLMKVQVCSAAMAAVSSQMRLVDAGKLYDGNDIVGGRDLADLEHKRQTQGVLFHVLQLIALLMMVASCSLWLFTPMVEHRLQPDSVGLVIATGCLLSTATYVATCARFYQRQLLRRLVFSFDFAFLSMQITLAHLCACDLFYWDARCLVVGASWFWMHWVITFDAITPWMKARLGCRRLPALIVLIFFTIGLGLLSFDLVFGLYNWDLQDRQLWKIDVFERHLIYHVAPLFFDRVWILLLWNGRLCARLSKTHDASTLVLIRGPVELDSIVPIPADHFSLDTTKRMLRLQSHLRSRVSRVLPHDAAVFERRVRSRSRRRRQRPELTISTARVVPLRTWRDATNAPI